MKCTIGIGQPGKGYGLKEGLQMAKILSDKRIDAIDVSSACYDTFNYWLEPVTFPCGWRRHLAQAVKEVVKHSRLIAANLIRTPELGGRTACTRYSGTL